jgi:hypothetical protein
MGIPEWLGQHGFELLSTVSIVVGLFVTAHSVRAEAKERKIQNLLALNAAHRDLWTKFLERTDLERIYDGAIDLVREPPTMAEKRFVHLLILHLRAAFKARRAGMEFADDAVAADIQQFFARPIPRHVWEHSKKFQDVDFVTFVEGNF